MGPIKPDTWLTTNHPKIICTMARIQCGPTMFKHIRQTSRSHTNLQTANKPVCAVYLLFDSTGVGQEHSGNKGCSAGYSYSNTDAAHCGKVTCLHAHCMSNLTGIKKGNKHGSCPVEGSMRIILCE